MFALHRPRVVAGLFLLGVLGGAATGCSVETEDTERSDSAVVLERARVEELVGHVGEASRKSEELSRTSARLIGLREPSDVYPLFAATEALTRALDPILQRLEERLVQLPPEWLLRAGYYDVPDAEYRSVIETIRGVRVTVAQMPAAASGITAFPANTRLSEEEKLRLRRAIDAYTDQQLSITARLTSVLAALQIWLTKATTTGSTHPPPPPPPPPPGLHELDAAAYGACDQDAIARANWERACQKMRNALQLSFSDWFTGLDCGTPYNDSLKPADYACLTGAGKASFRLRPGIQEVRKVTSVVRSEVAHEGWAIQSWTRNCEEFLGTVRSKYSGGARSAFVAGASCGVPVRTMTGPLHHALESTSYVLIAYP